MDTGMIGLNIIAPAAEAMFGDKATRAIEKLEANMKKATDKLELVAQGVYNYLKNTVEAIKSGDWKAIGSVILQIIMAVATGGVSLIFTAISIIVQSALAVMGVDPKIAAIAGMVISAIGNQFYPNASASVGNMMGNAVNKVGTAIQKGMEGIGNAVGKVLGPVGTIITKAGDGIQTAMEWVGDWLGADKPGIIGPTGELTGGVDAVLDGVVIDGSVQTFAQNTMQSALGGSIIENIYNGTKNALITVGVSEGLQALGVNTEVSNMLGSSISADISQGNWIGSKIPFVNTINAGITYGLSEIGDTLGLNSLEITGISIASESLFKGATGSNNFMTDFSSTINNQVSNTLHSMSQNVINSQNFDADFGDMALSSYSSSLGKDLSIGLANTFKNF
ncbi:MAG: hypothetical protein AAB267_02185, partial [Candidatus Desantisbacteria bacterium]